MKALAAIFTTLFFLGGLCSVYADMLDPYGRRPRHQHESPEPKWLQQPQLKIQEGEEPNTFLVILESPSAAAYKCTIYEPREDVIVRSIEGMQESNERFTVEEVVNYPPIQENETLHYVVKVEFVLWYQSTPFGTKLLRNPGETVEITRYVDIDQAGDRDYVDVREWE